MQIAITGINGFLGGHLAAALSRQGHALIGLIRPTARLEQLLALGAELRPVHYDQPDQLADALRGADAVVHAAAKIYGRGQGAEFAGNPTLTRQVLDAAIAAGIPHFVHLSTVGVYGFPRDRAGKPFVETDGHGPIHRWNLYSRSKVEAENIVLAAPIATTILRPTWIYGPGDTALLGRMIEVLRHRRFTWIGDGQNRISLLYVSDAVDALLRVLTNPRARGRVYNVAADDRAPTQEQFVRCICEQMGLPLPAKRVPYRVAYATGFLAECLAHLTAGRVNLPVTRLSVLAVGGQRAFSSDALRQELGWQPAVDFPAGMAQTAAWFRQ
jgi:nucleoside-diphosphate-sugar epimerase